MSEEIQKAGTSAALDRCSEEERAAYHAYREAGKRPISLQASVRLYEQFVHGASCAEIARLNRPFDLGAVVWARIDHKWDERKDAHIAKLFEQAGTLVRQTVMESVSFLHVAMAAAHKLHGEKMLKFLQTGDEKDLPEGFNLKGIYGYARLVETLMRVTGQDQQKTVKHTGEVGVTPTSAPAPLAPGQAAKLLAAVVADDKEK